MEYKDFLERFYHFCDSVIRAVNIHFRKPEPCTNVSVVISTRDQETPINDGWCNVILEIEGVKEFSFTENSRASYQVISDGLQIIVCDGLVFLDFGHFSDPPADAWEIRKSPFHIIAKSFSWKVESYRELL